MSVVKELASTLRAEWKDVPGLADVRIVATEGVLNVPRKLTAVLRRKGIERNPTAPASHRDVRVLLTIVHPSTDLDLAGEELDSVADDALDYLDKRPNITRNESVEFVGFMDRLAVDIPLTVLAKKKAS